MKSSEYLDYLLTRSAFARVYRERLLYPIIRRIAPGVTLDVGCGIGDYLRSKEGAIGVDIDPAVVDYCRSEGLEAYVVPNGSPFPFGNGYFDSIVCDNVIEHLEKPELLMLEISRVLKSNGRLVVGLPGIKGFAHDPTHVHFYRLDDICQLLSCYGFSCKSHFYAPIPLSFLSRFLSQQCLYVLAYKQ